MGWDHRFFFSPGIKQHPSQWSNQKIKHQRDLSKLASTAPRLASLHVLIQFSKVTKHQIQLTEEILHHLLMYKTL